MSGRGAGRWRRGGVPPWPRRADGARAIPIAVTAAFALVAAAGVFVLPPPWADGSGAPRRAAATERTTGGPGRAPGETSPASGPPEPPRAFVDTTWPQASGRVLEVREGGDLQAALDEARPGDRIVLQAGAVFEGSFRLPRKTGSEYIVVRTSAPDDRLPPPGRRIDPSYAPLLPKLQSAAGPVLATAPRAHHWRFVGLEIRPRPGVFLHNLVLLGGGESVLEKLPHHIVFDRCLLRGDPRRGTRRGIALNSRDTAVIDSWLADFKEVGADSQALAAWNGAGPFKIVNNHLEGAGENLIFGGDVPAIRDLVAADIEIRGNRFAKPLAWKEGDGAYAGVPWTVKNLFELKNARRVLFEDNVLERVWAHAQRGFAIVLTVRTEGDAAPWAVVEDVVIRRNLVRRAGAGVNILGIDDMSPGGLGRTRRILIADNLFDEVGGEGWGPGTWVQILNGAEGVRVEHNTALQRGTVLAADMRPSPGLVFRDNIAPHNEYGVHGSGRGVGLPALAHYFPDAVFAGNVLVGAPAGARYPEGNFLPATLADVGFADLAAGDYRLAADSPYRGAATDGRDPGADLEALRAVAAAAGAGSAGDGVRR